jgi:hypothetical protein
MKVSFLFAIFTLLSVLSGIEGVENWDDFVPIQSILRGFPLEDESFKEIGKTEARIIGGTEVK